MEEKPKERQRRVEVGIKVNLKYPDQETFEERFSHNVSRSGIFIRAKDPAPIGSRIHFEYRLANDSRVMRGVGIVRWVRPLAQAKEPEDPPGMGIEFVDLDKDTEALIDRIVLRFGEGKRAPQRRQTTTAPASKSAAPRRRDTGTVLAAADENALDALLDTLAEAGPIPEAPEQAAADALAALDRHAMHGELDLDPGGSEVALAPTPARKPELELDLDAPSAMPSPLDGLEDDLALTDDPAVGISGEASQLDGEQVAPARAPSPSDGLEDELEALTSAPAEQDRSGEVLAPPSPTDGLEDELDMSPLPAALSDELDKLETAKQASAGTLEELALPADELLARDATPILEPVSTPPPARATSAEPIATASPAALTLSFATDEVESRVGTSRFRTRSKLVDGGTEIVLPDIASWLLASFPSARAKVVGRELGLTVVADDDGWVALERSDGSKQSGRAVLLETLRQALDHPEVGEASPHVLVPATANSATRGLIIDCVRELGMENPELIASASAVVREHAPTLAEFERALVIEVALLETRVSLVEGGGKVVVARSIFGAGLLAADRRTSTLFGMELLRQHGMDVADDPSFPALLAEQTRAARRAASGAWQVHLAGAEVSLEESAVMRELSSLGEQVALTCDAIAQESEVELGDITEILLTAQEPTWPGLADKLESLLGQRPRSLP